MKILTSEMRGCRHGPEEWFTGTVWLDEIVIAAPALQVLAGVGLVQLQGQPAQTIRPGDTVWIEPGEVHWHGAAPGHTMVHLAMQVADAAGIDVAWLAHVSDQEYAASL